MKLEDLAKPLDIADDLFHRQYSRLTKKWEDRGRSKYSLSLSMDLFAIFTFLPGIAIANSSSIFNTLLYYTQAANIGHSTGASISGKREGNHPTGVKERDGKLIIDNKYLYFLDKIGKVIRSPELAVGAGLMVKGGIDLYNYFTNNDSSVSPEGVDDLFIGASLIANASAWFIRDSDPKILDKKPLWKTTYENLRDKIKFPSPQPAPAHILIPIGPDRNYRQ